MTRNGALLAILTATLGLGAATVTAQVDPAPGERVPQVQQPPSREPGQARKEERQPALSQEKIKQVEQALKDSGHDPGVVDGVMDQQTREALISFQKRNNLPTTGQIDEQTAQRLGVMIEERPATSPRAPGEGTPSRRAPKESGGY